MRVRKGYIIKVKIYNFIEALITLLITTWFFNGHNLLNQYF